MYLRAAMQLSSEFENNLVREIPVDEYMSCRSKFNGVPCVKLADYFIAGKSLCEVHFYVFMSRLFKKYYDQFNRMYDNNIEKKKSAQNYVLAVRRLLEKKDNFNMALDIYKMRLIYISYGIESYSYEGHLIKVYRNYSKAGDMKIFKNMDIKQQNEIESNRAKKLLHPHIAKFVAREYDNYHDCHIYIYRGVTVSFKEYIRYLPREGVNSVFIEIAEVISKFHRKSIVLGDISNANIAMNGKTVVLTSFYSNTEDCDIYGRTGQIHKSNILCADLITASVDCLRMKSASRYSDLESVMWFYLQCTNHPVILDLENNKKKEMFSGEDSDSDSSIFSINNIIKKKERFIKTVARQNNLLQVSSEGEFNLVDEVKRFIYYFS
jgi:hypothetical protein